MSKPEISVIIPTYNSSSFIAKTLFSLEKQTFKEYEVIIINDGSTDNTQLVLLNYFSTHPELNLRVIEQENRGIAGARNAGIREAKTRFVAFLDHDDVWYPDKLNKCYEILITDPTIDLVCHDELMRDDAGKVIRYLRHGPYSHDMYRRLLFRGNYLSTSATVVKTRVLLEEGMFREYPEFLTVEDYDLWLRLSKKHKFYFLAEVLGEYVINNRNASLNLKRHYKNMITMLRLNFKELEKKKVLDYMLINLKLSRTYIIIAKSLFKNKNFRNAFTYLLRSLLILLRYESN